MSDKHVIAALQRSVADLELRLREMARERDESRAELLSITQQLELEREASAQLRAELGERMRETAEAQREACAEAIRPTNAALSYYQAADIVRATPLVTDTKADGGTP